MTDTLGLFNRTGTIPAIDISSINGIGFATYIGATGGFQNLLVTATPEPSSFVLAGLGVAGLFLAARRRRA